MKSAFVLLGQSLSPSFRPSAARAGTHWQTIQLNISLGMSAWVYIMASRMNGTLYVGVTTDIHQRIIDHKNDVKPGFTSKYGVKRLVWFEPYDNVIEAIAQEKRLKNWQRSWRIQMIEKDNPEWDDLYDLLVSGEL